MLLKLTTLLLATAAVVSANQYTDELADKETSVQKLESFLKEAIKDDGKYVNTDGNVYAARKAAETNSELAPAADALVKISKLKGCDQETREALRLFISLDLGGRKRLEKILYHYFPLIPTNECLDQVEAEYKAAVAQFDDPRVTALIDRFWNTAVWIYRNNDWKFWINRYLSSPKPTEGLDSYKIDRFADEISNDVKALAGDDPKAKVHEQSFNKTAQKWENNFYPENYKYAFETYLLAPCKQFTEKTAKIFEGFFGVAKFLTNPKELHQYADKVEWRRHKVGYFQGELYKKHHSTSFYLSKEVQKGLMAYKRCQLIESYDEGTYKAAFNTADLRKDNTRLIGHERVDLDE